MLPIVVGFDLDMTLIDSRPGIAVVWDALAAETGVPIDTTAVVSRLGPPLARELATWYAADQVDAMAVRFRALYPSLAIEASPAMPGARESIAAVHRHGGRAIVVTAKHEPNARLHVDHLSLDVDGVVGGLWSAAKGAALRDHGAVVYVGDHVGDIAGAKAAGALAVGVATGALTVAELAAAGADVVLESLADFPQWLDAYVLDAKLAELEANLREHGTLLVAFSGGADSAFLLAAAVRAVGSPNVVAATAVSSSLPAVELAAAGALARNLGVRHLTPHTDELARDGYRANGAGRCYFCKAELLDVLVPLATKHGLAAIATGTNHDDAVADFRPGIRAAAERGAVTPLRDVMLTKAEIREASRQWGLCTWDKPAAACLSSRVAYGVSITSARLARVERAEAALRAIFAAAGRPVRDLRVRDLGDRARIEVDRSLVSVAAGSPAVIDAVRAAGFEAAEVDPRGFRSGSMNDDLRRREPRRGSG